MRTESRNLFNAIPPPEAPAPSPAHTRAPGSVVRHLVATSLRCCAGHVGGLIMHRICGLQAP